MKMWQKLLLIIACLTVDEIRFYCNSRLYVAPADLYQYLSLIHILLGGDVASGYFKTLPEHLILGMLPKDSTEIIQPEHLTSNRKVNYKLGDTVTLDVGDRTLDGRRLGQDTPVYTYDSETQVEIMSGERLENTEPRTYTVVGIYERPTFEDYSAPGYTALTAADTKLSLIHI